MVGTCAGATLEGLSDLAHLTMPLKVFRTVSRTSGALNRFKAAFALYLPAR